MDVVNNPPFIGGCPLLNTAVESDNAHPILREKAREGLAGAMKFLIDIIDKGIHSGEFQTELHAESLASFVLSLLEGGVMLASWMATINICGIMLIILLFI
jgi:TetR/AcrR family transcriptional regulator, transcriptional repressor for nem operon